MIRAVIFDVGGPLDLETAHEAAIDAAIREGLRREGFDFTEDEWDAANTNAVAVHAPNLYQAMTWHLTNGDVDACQRIYDSLEAGSAERDFFELRPGISDVLAALKQRASSSAWPRTSLSAPWTAWYAPVSAITSATRASLVCTACASRTCACSCAPAKTSV